MIRKFDANVSAMKKLAARDWEDLLQVFFLLFWLATELISLFPVRNPSLRRTFAQFNP